MRHLVWFSAGAASAVATKLVLAENHDDVVVAYLNPGSEHPDNERFLADCEAWFDHPIERLKSEKYEDTWQVWSERRYLVGPTGALCTAELKKKPRFAFERPDDIQVFGYTAEETHRADRFREQNPGVTLRTPLVEHQLTKSDCLAMVDRAGIELPAMYRLGYSNNNCIGCVKGGATGTRSGVRSKTHCPQGHPYDEKNTYWHHGRHRQCRACKRLWKAAR